MGGKYDLRHFRYSHLPSHFQRYSKVIHDVASEMVEALPAGAERNAGLRKLLEAKGPTLPRMSHEEDSSNFLVFDYEKGWQMFSLACPYGIWRKEPFAWGSGADHAITALDAGLTVTQAIILAAKRDPHTDDNVKIYDLKDQMFVE